MYNRKVKVKSWLEDMVKDISIMYDIFKQNLITKEDVEETKILSVSEHLMEALVIMDDMIFEMEHSDYEREEKTEEINT